MAVHLRSSWSYSVSWQPLLLTGFSETEKSKGEKNETIEDEKETFRVFGDRIAGLNEYYLYLSIDLPVILFFENQQ